MATVEDNVDGLEKHLMNFGEEIVTRMRNGKKGWNYYGKNGVINSEGFKLKE